MPSNVLFMDTLFPHVNEEDSTQSAIKKILNYDFMLREQLQYTIFNLGAPNFNKTEWDNLTQPIYASIGDSEKKLTELALTTDGLGLRVSNAEQGIAELTITAGGLTATVSGLATDLGTLSSQVSIQAGKISSIVANVGSNGTVTAASIVQSVNSSGSSVKISADKIQMTGTTTFLTADDLGESGSTRINGSLITTGSLDADLITSGVIKGIELISSTSIRNSDRREYGQIVDIVDGNISFSYKSSASSSRSWYGEIYADDDSGNFYLHSFENLKLESDYGVSIDADIGDVVWIGTSHRQSVQLGHSSGTVNLAAGSINIGDGSSSIHLNGKVYINGVLQ